MFTAPIKHLTSNLESLREFIDLLDSYLVEKATETMSSHANDLAPLVYFAKKAGLPIDDDFEGLTADEIKDKLKKSNDIEVDVEVSGSTEKPEYKLIIDGKGKVKFEKAINEMSKSHKRMDLLYRGSLMNLTSIVELFVSQLLHKQFAKNPDAISTKDKLFSIDDLIQYDSVEDVKQHYINTKIEEILYGSFTDWVTYIKNTNKLSMGYLDTDMDILKETFLRRNLIVHNGGIINSIYLLKAPKIFTKDAELGSGIEIDRNYINRRIDLFERNCVLIAAELWKKLDQADESRGEVLNHSAYHHMLGKRWMISESLSYFVMQDKQLTEPTQTIAKINFWLSKKRQGKWDEIKEEVLALDFSAKNFTFELALAALTERIDKFYEILPNALVSKQISLAALNEFPVFEEIRSDSRFDEYRKEKSAPENPILDSDDVKEQAGESEGVAESYDSATPCLDVCDDPGESAVQHTDVPAS
jgi:hypothetical protein